MATGNIHWFASAILDIGNGAINLGSDVLKMGICTTATAPTINSATPTWGGTGSTNFSATQVATATSYTGPITLASPSWTLLSNIPTFQGNSITLAQDSGGFTNGAWGIIYDNTNANKRCVAYVEISAAGTASLVSGSLSINFSGSTDILTITPA